MYNFSDAQCRILKLLGKDFLKGSHNAILYPSDIKGIKDTELLLQEFVNDGLFVGFKKIGNRGNLSAEETAYIKKAYGNNIIDLVSAKDGDGYLIYASRLFEDDWDSIAKSIKAHERVNLHGGIRFELKYNQDNKYALRYFDYIHGYEKLIKKVYAGSAIEGFLDYGFSHPGKIIKKEDIHLKKTKNISQIIKSLKMPKVIEEIFFHDVKCESALFTPVIREKGFSISYDMDALRYMEGCREI